MSRPARRVRVELGYDGTDFAGWQRQPRARTVQGTLEAALARLHGGTAVTVRGAGRTDAGAHARAQVADAEVTVDLDDAELARALSGILPADVRPRGVRTVDPTFHARHDAVAKIYRYRVDRTPWGDPFRARFTLHRSGALDLEALRDALARLPGRRDWSGFAGAACEVEDRTRTLSRAELELEPQELAFVFEADGFLTHMVRNLVGTLIDIGSGRFAPARIDEILGAGDRRLAGATAPAQGLVLERVRYADDDAAGR